MRGSPRNFQRRPTSVVISKTSKCQPHFCSHLFCADPHRAQRAVSLSYVLSQSHRLEVAKPILRFYLFCADRQANVLQWPWGTSG
ncbi:unnamed protein product [Callosobruchus maculatus]|uniref:Uncharacterized protein n=1 Tax=Callosobruchus maculatus TaxID=64391 RepID=A0A653C326_CALMS|nr:unnamed protein product [Callosobruchus maculatus]